MGEAITVRELLVKKRISFLTKVSTWLYKLFIERQLLFFMIGLLLGRAVILYEISPFAIAFIAATTLIKTKRIFTITMFVIIGAWTYSFSHGLYITLAVTIFFIIYYFIKDRMRLKWLMAAVFLSSV